MYFKNAIPNHREILNSIDSISNGIITEWMPWGNKYSTSLEQKQSHSEIYGVGKTIYDPIFDRENVFTDTHWIYNSIHKSVEHCSEIYKKMFLIGDDNPRLVSTGYVIGKYDIGTSRGLHSDCPYDDMEHSYVIYLNDDYEGGEIDFPELKIHFKPEAGSIIMFKSNDVDNIHQASPVTKGSKYIIPHFWRMGPSQGFLPYGLDFNSFVDYVSDENNLIHDFDNLKIVDERKKEFENKS